MQLILSPDDLRPLVRECLAEMLDQYGDATRVALSETDAAAAVGIEPTTLATLRRAGEVPAAQIGRGYIYQRSDLVRLVARRKTGDA